VNDDFVKVLVLCKLLRCFYMYIVYLFKKDRDFKNIFYLLINHNVCSLLATNEKLLVCDLACRSTRRGHHSVSRDNEYRQKSDIS